MFVTWPISIRLLQSTLIHNNEVIQKMSTKPEEAGDKKRRETNGVVKDSGKNDPFLKVGSEGGVCDKCHPNSDDSGPSGA